MKNNIQSYNLHSHTARCGHAKGTDEEYVLSAIEAGFKILGFSDHIFLPGASDPRMRGNYEMLDEYLKSIGDLQEKYKDKIQIFKGFEAEWFGQRYEDYYKDLLNSKKIDYLILGQHCQMEGNRFFGYGYFPDADYARKEYTADLIAGMESGLFTYVCHPDLFVPWGPGFDELAYHLTLAICEAALRLDLPLEVNMGPSRYRHRWEEEDVDFEHIAYPNPRFWDIVGRYGCKVLFGVDAHAPAHYQQTHYDAFLRFAKERNLNLVKECPLKK